jgi:hypothetical protein
MGRAIVRHPQAFLMDEPLSNLDAKLRVQVRAEISKLQHDLDVTTIYVTHDQVEAMTMGDRVAVMRKGELQQVAPPEELYDHPVNLFVGGFIGSPAMNVLEARLERHNGDLRVVTGDQTLTLDQRTLEARPRLADYEGHDVVLGIRPENLEDAALANGAAPDRRLHGTVELREGLGSEIVVHLAVRARPAITEDIRELAEDLGEEPALTEDGETTAIVARFDPHSRVREGRDGGRRRRHHRAALLRPRDRSRDLRQPTERGGMTIIRVYAVAAAALAAILIAASASGRLRTQEPPCREEGVGNGLDHLRGNRRRAGALQERAGRLREALSGHRHEVHVGGTAADDNPSPRRSLEATRRTWRLSRSRGSCASWSRKRPSSRSRS